MFIDIELGIDQTDEEQWKPKQDEQNDKENIQLDSLFDLLHENISRSDRLSVILSENG